MKEELFSIVVADDEEGLLDAMCSLIDWESIGFQLVGRAGNGLDALQLVEQLEPDLLLTDIQMPFITGTELARQVRELQPLIQVAFLSGYDDFEYAQSAIEHQVISYLLKPISMAELTAALADIHGKMADRFNELRTPHYHAGQHVTVASILLDQMADPPAESVLLKQLADCGLVFTEPYSLTVLAMQSDSLDPGAAETVDKVLHKYYSSCSILSGGRVLSLVISEDSFARLGTALDELYYVVKRLLSESCIIGVSRPFNKLSRANAACREAVDAVRLADGPGISRISGAQSHAEERMQGEQRQASQFDRLLFGTSRRELEEYLHKVMDPMTGELSILQIFITVRNILQTALGNEETDLLLQRSRLEDPLSAGIDCGELRRRVMELCLSGNDLLVRQKRDSMSLLVERTLQIIQQEYMDETLSLYSVSERLHVSPNYLSANMKKYAGETFISLLIKTRMEAAKVLIQTGGMKIGEVAERCGYNDQHYFSFCFKKYFGISPVKMRRGEEDLQ